MLNVTRKIFIGICLVLLAVNFVLAQGKPAVLSPKQIAKFSLVKGGEKAFVLQMKKDGYAEVKWVAADSLSFTYCIADSAGKILDMGGSSETDSVDFIAPGDGDYIFLVRLDPSTEADAEQAVSLEYKNVFKLPANSKQKDIRRINGYDVRIMNVPGSDPAEYDSLVMVEKDGRLKNLLKGGGGADYIGFSFSDSPNGESSAASKRAAEMIKETPDKTGDGVPDVMIDYFSGGAHCCFSTYFINLDDTAVVADVVDTGNAQLTAYAKNPKGGLRFRTNDNAFAYWNTSFASSPLPEVILEFQNGKLRTNFELMNKPAPTLATMKTKASAARAKIGKEPYTGVDTGDFGEAFWDEMLDLIYQGNEAVAWQYFDLVWPAEKQGKALFLTDFKSQLAESYYGTREITNETVVKKWQPAIEKALRELKGN